MKTTKQVKGENAKLIQKTLDTKWLPVQAGLVPIMEAIPCTLCKKYARKECYGCPIYRKTNNKNCHNTPFYAYRKASKWALVSYEHAKSTGKLNSIVASWPEAQLAAKAHIEWEITFLQDLQEACNEN